MRPSLDPDQTQTLRYQGHQRRGPWGGRAVGRYCGGSIVTRQRFCACRKLDDFGRDLFLSQLMLALRKPAELRFDVGFGGGHRHHPRLVLGSEGVHRGFTELCIDIFAGKSFEQQERSTQTECRAR